MPTTKVVSSSDGPRLTVNQIIRQPLFVRARMLSISENQFVVDSVLRNAGSAPGGAVVYDQSTPLFLDAASAPDVAEGAQIPVLTGSLGQRKAARTVKKALGIEITEEMRSRNQVDRVNTLLTQARNTMVRTWDKAFLSMLLAHPDVPTMAAGDAADTSPVTDWSSPTAKIRDDLLLAIQTVTEATTGDQTDNWFGFEPDVLVINPTTRGHFFTNSDVVQVYQNGGPITSRNIRYTGALERDLLGLSVLVSRDVPLGKALVAQRSILGGIADERPLTSSPLMEDRNKEVWRSNYVRTSALFVDQPKAAIIIDTGEAG